MGHSTSAKNLRISNSFGSSRTDCVACFTAVTPFGHRLGYIYGHCSECGTVQLMPLPTAEELSRAYVEKYAVVGHLSAIAARALDWR